MPSVIATDSVTVTAPNGGELWDETNSITWTNVSTNTTTETFTFEYRQAGETTYTTIATGESWNSGTYSWDTSAVPDGNYYVRVTKTNVTASTSNDVSDNFFTLDNTPGSSYYEEPTPTPEPHIATPSTMIESLKSPLGIILVVAVLALGYLLWKKK